MYRSSGGHLLYQPRPIASVLHANLISCRVGFVLSCFYKSSVSCSGFIEARTVQYCEIASTCQIQ